MLENAKKKRYQNLGFNVVPIGPGSVKERVEKILTIVNEGLPEDYMANYDENYCYWPSFHSI